MRKNIKILNGHLFVAVATASSIGLLLGFNIALINGVLPFIKQCWFGLSVIQREWIIFTTLLGAIAGSAFSGYLADKYGRKNLLIISAIVYALGSALSGASSNIFFLDVSRVIQGLAMGISSVAVPLYLSEISPARQRGALVLTFPLMIVLGIILSYFLNIVIDDEFNPFSWRGMFYAGVFLSIIQFILMLFLPETPAYLFSQGNINEGKSILKKVNGIEESEIYSDDYILDFQSAKLNSKFGDSLFKPGIRLSLIIAIIIMIFQQLIGINALTYYAPGLVLLAGLNSKIVNSDFAVLIGIVSFVAAISAILLVDKIGRRKLYLVGLTGTGIALIGFGIIFLFKASLGFALQPIIFFSVSLYFFSFALGIVPIAWLLVSEIFPYNMRAVGITIAVLSYWIVNMIIAFIFLKITEFSIFPDSSVLLNGPLGSSKAAGIFFLYSAITLIGIILGIKYLPETKGVNLKYLDDLWMSEKTTIKL